MRKTAKNEKENFSLYLTYSEGDEKTGMICTDAGFADVKPYSAYPPDINNHPDSFKNVAIGRTLPEFQILYISRGEGIFVTNQKTFRVKPGSMLLVLPGQKHHYKPLHEIGWVEYWAGFNGMFFNNLVREKILTQDHSYLELGLHDHIINAFEEIFSEVHTQRPLYQIKACSCILKLIAEVLVYERRKDQPNYYQSIVEKAKYLMGANIYSEINLSGISKQLGLSLSRFNVIFKTYTSMTPYQYFIHIKINRAKNLLENENLSVKEVAYRVGFEDQYYFSRLFRSKTGVAPSAWKKFIRSGV
ncbi:MAG: AraC family transcriptional regulator [Treponema sp.]|nr:AraC family transcriptional regulator [Treponema sp.]